MHDNAKEGVDDNLLLFKKIGFLLEINYRWYLPNQLSFVDSRWEKGTQQAQDFGLDIVTFPSHTLPIL